ncbi:hypothetical protein ACFX1S_034597 [Malus domestica]
MWKIKFGEGANDPMLFSTNNFHGRQKWEFDPNAGIEDERAEVEAAREHFYQNRFKEDLSRRTGSPPSSGSHFSQFSASKLRLLQREF